MRGTLGSPYVDCLWRMENANGGASSRSVYIRESARIYSEKPHFENGVALVQFKRLVHSVELEEEKGLLACPCGL